jgi:hypothetical protein
MAYTISQKLIVINKDQNQYEDQITSDNAENVFIAVTANTLPEGSTEREITVQLIDMEGAPEENVTNSGMYVKQERETSVKATLLDQEGKEVASNVTEY